MVPEAAAQTARELRWLLLSPPLLLFSLLLPPLVLLLPPFQQLTVQLLLSKQRLLLHWIRLAGLQAQRQAGLPTLTLLW